MARNFVIDVVIKGRDLLSGPLGNAGRKISKFGLEAGTGARRLAGALGSTRNLIVGTVAALGVKKAWDGINSWSEGADKVGKSAFRLGMAAKDLQAWQRAAEMADVPASKFTAAVGKMSDNMGRLRTGQGQLFGDLKRVAPGLLEQAMATKNNSEALDLFARALDQTHDAAERESLARMVFGRGGGDMITLIKDGYPELRKLMEEMEGYGLVTDEAARNAEIFNDEQTRLKYSIEGVKNELGARLIPLLTPYITKVKEWITANRGLIATRLEEFLRRTYDRLRPIGRWFRDNKDAIWGALSFGGQVIADLVTGTANLLAGLGKFPGVAKVAAGGFIAAMVAMNTNPQFMALLAAITALQATLNWLDARSVENQDDYINRRSPGIPVFTTPEQVAAWEKEQDRKSQDALQNSQSYAPGYGPSDNILLDTVLASGGTLKFSLEGAPNGVIEMPISLTLDKNKLPEWLGATPVPGPAAKVGVRSEAWGMSRNMRR